jgi:hypothetical protein
MSLLSLDLLNRDGDTTLQVAMFKITNSAGLAKEPPLRRSYVLICSLNPPSLAFCQKASGS